MVVVEVRRDVAHCGFRAGHDAAPRPRNEGLADGVGLIYTTGSKAQRPDETLLTGDVADRVRAAALAENPGATIQRVETDSDGVYEAHLVTTEGEWVTVEVGEDFAVTGTESARGGGRPPRPDDDTESESS
jgi:hypothetical protein